MEGSEMRPNNIFSLHITSFYLHLPILFGAMAIVLHAVQVGPNLAEEKNLLWLQVICQEKEQEESMCISG